MRTTLLPVVAIAALLAGAHSALAGDSPYGINAHVPTDAELDRCVQGGIRWVRVDFNWSELEPARGKFNWTAADRVVQAARQRGLSVFATLAYAPAWATGGQASQFPATDPRDWYDFVHATVERYRGSVHHWGMWNEPNLTQFFRGTKDQYVNEILAVGAKAVKDADQSGLVLGPELAHMADWEKWLAHVLRNGAQHLDVVTHHIYKDDTGKLLRLLDGFTWPWEPANVKSVVTKNGGAGKPFWLTEVGWSTDKVSYADHAAKLRELLAGVDKRGWIHKVFLYELRDDPNWVKKFGLLEASLTPKPAWFACRDHIAARAASGAPAPSPAPGTPAPATPPAVAPPGRFQAVFEAERDLSHEQGRKESDGWACNTADHSASYLSFGPYTTAVPAGAAEALFRLLVDNNDADDGVVVTLEVNDADAGKVLAKRDVRRKTFTAPFAYQELALPFQNPGGHRLEFRVHWKDTSYVRQDRVTVRTP